MALPKCRNIFLRRKSALARVVDRRSLIFGQIIDALAARLDFPCHFGEFLLVLDLQIIVRTARAVLRGKGAY